LYRQAGLTLVEMMVSIAIAMTVMSGVVQVLLVSKVNFVTERELSALQENARFAIKYLGDEIRMAGFTGCKKPLTSNSINGSKPGDPAEWYLSDLGMTGYENGGAFFPSAFSADVLPNTDALAVRKGEDTGWRVAPGHVAASGIVPVHAAHTFSVGQPLVLVSAECAQASIVQNTGPVVANQISITTGGGATPGNCLIHTAGPQNCPGTASTEVILQGSRVMYLRSEAYYVGASESDATVPALFRERMLVNTSTSTIYTAAEELVQGVENMQIVYGVNEDGDADAIADKYLKAGAGGLTTAEDWKDVVTVRLMLRMRSVNPVYNENVAYPEFEGVPGTDGSDRFMRQNVTTTIQIRNG
jgi:type IV pilus assembly protein PilW